ncbi:hypothetical protein Taro_006439 [Colocasia esculenta]|uniref:RING-type E3 ubiquitin transferase n=1 Tax=Colocasia esculenta TaxID=4460 RepID=A0A843TX13_COLES|nr:hypothetical protein [Colocasia esculenta]
MALGRRILLEEECGETQSCSPSFAPPSPPVPNLPPPAEFPEPAPSSPPPLPSSPPTKIQISNKNHFVTQVVIVVISVLAVCLLLLALYAFYRCWSSSRRRRRRRAVALAAAWGPPQPPADAEGDLLREDLLMAGEEPYHVWYIRTVGLDQTVIGAITVCEYKKGEGLVEDTDCAVCLGEFGDGEPLRLLPKCSHAFHVPCIDTWLRSHVNCPLCRAPVLAPPPARAPIPPSPPLPSPAVEGNNLASDVAAAAAAQQSSRQATEGEDSAGVGDSLRRIAPEDGSEDGGNSAQGGFGVDRPAAGASFSSEESETWMSIDLGDGGLGDETAPDATAPEEGDRDRELQPVRRSISMDSPAMAGLLLRMRLAGNSRDGRRKPSVDASTNKKAGNGENHCKGASLHDAPLEMERCMSGGRFSLSRFSGRGRGAILPL